MVALTAGNDAIACGLAVFEMELTREFDGGFCGFGAAGGEIDTPAGAKIRRGESEEAVRQFFRGVGVKLRAVREGDLGGLLRHCLTDFGYAVTDADYGRLAARVEKTSTTSIDYPAAFAADGDGIVFAEIPGEQGGVGWHFDTRIVAERKFGWCQGFTIVTTWDAAMLRPYVRGKSVIGWRAFSGMGSKR